MIGMMLRRGAASLLLLLSAVGVAGAQSLPFRCWTIADGLAQSVVNTLLEDSRGYLWIATASGLSRFDGLEFVNFDAEHGLPNQRIYALFEDSAGTLWAGTDGGLARLPATNEALAPGPEGALPWRKVAVESPLARSRVLAIAEGAEGRLLIGTRGAGVFLLDPSGDEAVRVDGAPETVAAIVRLRGVYWLAAADGLHRFDGERFERPIPGAPFSGGPLEALAVSRAGELLVAGRDGAFALDPASLELRRLAEAEPRGWLAVAETRPGRFFLGSHHRGLLRHDGETATRLDRTSGLPADGVRSLLRHSDGALWVGTYGGGVCRLGDESFVRFTEEHGLPNEQVLGLAETPDGALWVGMLEGGVARWDGEGFEVFDQRHGLRSPAVTYLAVSASRRGAPGGGTLWAGTLRGGLHRWRGDGFEAARLGPEAHSIFHILPDGEALWISTWGAGLLRFEPATGERRELRAEDGLFGDRLFSTSKAPDGRLWIATPDGVQVLEPGAWTLSGFDAELDPPGRTRAVVHDDRGRAYLATDRGVAVWDGVRFSYWGRREGLASNTVYLLHFDRAGRLWLGSERGLDRFELDAEGAIRSLRHFGAEQGFTGVETNQNAVLEDGAGRLFFGTRGLARFDPAEEPPPPSPPRLELVRLGLFDGTTIPHRGAPPELPWHRNDLLFELVALDFHSPASVRYRYRLLGQGESYSPPSTSRTAVFPRLEPGSYRFEAQAASRGGEWSEPVRLDLMIRPPLWATWWFRGLAALLLGVLVAGWVGARVGRSRRRRRELESAVEERTRELAQAKQAAEAASEAKSEFLSNMSHELRTPLTGVVSAAELLAKTGLDVKQGHLVESIETSGRVLLSVINDILDQARIDALGLHVDSREFSPVTCFEECLEVVRHRAESKGLELAGVVGEGVPERALGDPVRFRQVLLNLLGNAIKFTDEGRVDATIERGEARGDRLQLLLEVRDTGIGIEPELQRRIFEPFQQADSSATRSHGGTGLGLSIVERLVSLMGGHIELESEKGRGSTFRFDVEVALPSETAEVERPPELPAVRADLKVLLAEDNPISQAITSSQLESLGLRPHVAANGLEAARLARELEPEVIFMDGQMPEMDGYQATRQIRAGEEQRSIIIIGLTAHATAEARGRCLDAGMDDYLAKPVHLADLAERLAHWFPP